VDRRHGSLNSIFQVALHLPPSHPTPDPDTLAQHRVKKALYKMFNQFGLIESMRFRSFAAGSPKLTKAEALRRYSFSNRPPQTVTRSVTARPEPLLDE